MGRNERKIKWEKIKFLLTFFKKVITNEHVWYYKSVISKSFNKIEHYTILYYDWSDWLTRARMR